MKTIEYTPKEEGEPMVPGASVSIRPASGYQRGLYAGQGQVEGANLFKVMFDICKAHVLGWRGFPIDDCQGKNPERLKEWEPEWIIDVAAHVIAGCPTSDDMAGNSESSSDA